LFVTKATSRLSEHPAGAALCPRTPVTYRQDTCAGLALPPASPMTAPSLADAKPLRAQPFRLSILMLAYNDECTIVQAVDEILAVDCPCDVELIVIDDGSTDGTPALLSQVDDPRVRVHRHATHLGRRAALLAAAYRATGTHILPFNAGLEYSPEDISRMVEPVLKGRCDVVYGVRLFGCNTVYHSYRYAVGNQLLTRMANLLFDAYLTDLHTCLKLIPLAMLRNLGLSEKGSGLDSEVTARLLRRGIRPFEVPVSFYSRPRGDGQKMAWRYAVASIWRLLRVRVRVRDGGLSHREPLSIPHQDDEPSRTVLKDPGPAQLGYLAAVTAGDGDSDGDGDGLTLASHARLGG
jgi:hypothetical protein